MSLKVRNPPVKRKEAFHFVNELPSVGFTAVAVLACVAVVALCDKAPVYAPPPPAYAPAPYHAPEPAYHAPKHYEPEHPEVPAKYNYNYGVSDEYSGANFDRNRTKLDEPIDIRLIPFDE
ncbi:vitelline membrane protein 15a-2-like [Penaeus japonicus]|uniref:vitelline membrane protein 15a-2-like n=1 Tax=Penaeus japonicus TaxID=27405 RepID=UPI001C714EE1|nr:vitelline membrane protein 15a-2-like [Penaeus japonicus]